LGKWVHFFIMRLVGRATNKNKSGDMNRGYHSRALEQRVEVCKGRLFVHALPQLMDNLGYLVVCCPEEKTAKSMVVTHSNGPNERISVTTDEKHQIVAFVVDCGDAEEVATQVQLISERHYGGKSIEIQSILSTHKHHDHTAGNKGLLSHESGIGESIKTVFGGAVEKVPHCNFPVVNGEMLPLPRYGDNEMGAIAQVEVIATPAHTRGSVCYALRPAPGLESTSSGLAFLFTGDTFFCAGGGVPFEADIEHDQDTNASRMTSKSFIKASAANHAIERCFAEILGRSVNSNNIAVGQAVSDRLLVFPGHEYTAELLTRQLAISSSESCRWKNFAPAVFFETVSQLYVAIHRRSLPHSSGKLLNVPSTVRRELLINPNFRSLGKRGDVIITAIKQWHRHFAKDKVPEDLDAVNGSNAMHTSSPISSDVPTKSIATQDRWNLDSKDVDRPVFATVYASDLDSIIAELNAGKIAPQNAARRLEEMKRKLDAPVVGRRAIPGTLPTDRTVYKGLLGFVLLGSHPTALTLSDSRTMKLPPPVVGTSDRIRVSKKRLIAVLNLLGLLREDNDGKMIVAMIHQLWKEVNECAADTDAKTNGHGTKPDVETDSNDKDLVELGMLKWIVYGLAASQPSWFSKFCMPCSKVAPAEPTEPSPASKSDMNRQHGELVRHDIFTCYLCRSAAGCPAVMDETIDTAAAAPTLYAQPALNRFGSTITTTEEGEGDRAFIEITPETLGMHF
jgi:glyoxylase-like metal-dependent hydrolase (beta-lactamase superfamily II)